MAMTTTKGRQPLRIIPKGRYRYSSVSWYDKTARERYTIVRLHFTRFDAQRLTFLLIYNILAKVKLLYF
ncbi:hypothetical protein HQ584_09515 [Patescibacteria group bacterium]|nr:hypothetical protein [Patescibacteria group bacterium]